MTSFERKPLTTETRLRDVQEWMSRVRGSESSPSPAQLGDWIAELDMARDEAAAAASSFRSVSDVSDALRLLSKLLAAADTTRISGDEVGCLLDMLQGRLEVSLEQVRSLYL